MGDDKLAAKNAAPTAVIIGGGINGLVAANYLRRAQFDVTLLESKDHVGGACSSTTLDHEGRQYVYPNGASVLGFMQDFVFRDTGLEQRLSVYSPKHPEVVYFGLPNDPCVLHDDPEKLKAEMKEKWGEEGKVTEFFEDMETIATYLREGYRQARAPSLEHAEQELGRELVDLWIKGSATNLLNHYFTSEYAKMFLSVSATESGPVPLDAPYSAFTIPMMVSGSVFDGKWGFVKDGLWTLTETLGQINDEIGVRTLCSAPVTAVAEDDMTVAYEQDGQISKLRADFILFATDPLRAAELKGDRALAEEISGKELTGSSGKVVLLFKKPVVWKDNTGLPDFDMAFRFIMPPIRTLGELDANSLSVKKPGHDFLPGCVQIYCEGAGHRKLGGGRDYEIVSIFFKNLALDKKGEELPEVKQAVQDLVLSHIENPEDLFASVLLTPQNLKELFYFPGGNIDHVELGQGQTFEDRTYSAAPKESFYRFGSHPHIFYCAAGAYPCGSIAGTPGYLCAQEVIAAARNVPKPS